MQLVYVASFVLYGVKKLFSRKSELFLKLQVRRRQDSIGMPLHCCIWRVNNLTSGASSFLRDAFVVQADSSKLAPKLKEVKKKKFSKSNNGSSNLLSDMVRDGQVSHLSN